MENQVNEMHGTFRTELPAHAPTILKISKQYTDFLINITDKQMLERDGRISDIQKEKQKLFELFQQANGQSIGILKAKLEAAEAENKIWKRHYAELGKVIERATNMIREKDMELERLFQRLVRESKKVAVDESVGVGDIAMTAAEVSTKDRGKDTAAKGDESGSEDTRMELSEKTHESGGDGDEDL
jgi:hypothetical protein